MIESNKDKIVEILGSIPDSITDEQLKNKTILETLDIIQQNFPVIKSEENNVEDVLTYLFGTGEKLKTEKYLFYYVSIKCINSVFHIELTPQIYFTITQNLYNEINENNTISKDDDTNKDYKIIKDHISFYLYMPEILWVYSPNSISLSNNIENISHFTIDKNEGKYTLEAKDEYYSTWNSIPSDILTGYKHHVYKRKDVKSKKNQGAFWQNVGRIDEIIENNNLIKKKEKNRKKQEEEKKRKEEEEIKFEKSLEGKTEQEKTEAREQRKKERLENIKRTNISLNSQDELKKILEKRNKKVTTDSGSDEDDYWPSDED